ncbi:hypothetical protein GJ904_19915 [Salmonella enterica]|nr:hypothetical protein [Salmonella enterica subsp. enterica serovar Saintpaul]EEC1303331.1 hypothetical protein [Salmonella enterica]
MTSSFVSMLLQKAEDERVPNLPELGDVGYTKEPRLEMRTDAEGNELPVVHIGKQQYTRIDGVHYVYITALINKQPSAYWRKVSESSFNLMRQINETIDNGRENA